MSLQAQKENIQLMVKPGERRLDKDQSDRPSRFLPVSIGLVVLTALGGVIWYAYSWGFGGDDGDLPVIRADAGSGKSRPESPGGLEVAHQDKLVLNNPTPDLETPQVERLLPPLEVPKPPTPSVAPKQIATPPVSSTPPAPAEPSAIAKAPLTMNPRIIGTRPLLPTANQDGQAPVEAAGDLGIPPPPISGNPPTQTAALSPAGPFVVQLASLRAADRATAAWERLQKAFPSLLGGRTLLVEEVDLGSRGNFYRVQVESFQDRAEAAALCVALKARKQDCLVVKR